MSRAVLQPFEEYQKARINFVQTIADLASKSQNIEALNAAGLQTVIEEKQNQLNDWLKEQ